MDGLSSPFSLSLNHLSIPFGGRGLQVSWQPWRAQIRPSSARSAGSTTAQGQPRPWKVHHVSVCFVHCRAVDDDDEAAVRSVPSDAALRAMNRRTLHSPSLPLLPGGPRSRWRQIRHGETGASRFATEVGYYSSDHSPSADDLKVTLMVSDILVKKNCTMHVLLLRGGPVLICIAQMLESTRAEK